MEGWMVEDKSLYSLCDIKGVWALPEKIMEGPRFHKYVKNQLPDNVLRSLDKILDAILNDKIDYGRNRTYCFVTDEDGELCFMKNEHEGPKEFEDTDWPANRYDGTILWECSTGLDRGLDITTAFLEALKIQYN